MQKNPNAVPSGGKKKKPAGAWGGGGEGKKTELITRKATGVPSSPSGRRNKRTCTDPKKRKKGENQRTEKEGRGEQRPAEKKGHPANRGTD